MYSLGVDVGSVSTDFVLTDENRKIIESLYLRTHGDPAGTVARGMKELKENTAEMKFLPSVRRGAAECWRAAFWEQMW